MVICTDAHTLAHTIPMIINQGIYRHILLH